MLSLVMENNETADSDRVSLMTLHGAKGLEFDTVFLPGWEEGLFPNQRALDEAGEKSLEEERRLAYVGLTRARRRAIISHAANRRIDANWQSSISQPLHRGITRRRRGADRPGGTGSRCADIGGDNIFWPVPFGGTANAHDRGLGAAGTSGAGRRHTYWFPGVPREIRLRHREGGRGRPVGCGV